MSKNDLGRPAKHPFCVTFPCRGCKNKPQDVALKCYIFFFWQLPGGEKSKKQTITATATLSMLASQHIAFFFSFSLVKWTKIKINVISLLFWIHSGEKISISLKKKTKMKRDIGVAVPHRFAFHLPKLDNRG